MKLDPDNPPAWLLLVDYRRGMTSEQVARMADLKAAQWRRFCELHADDPKILALPD